MPVCNNQLPQRMGVVSEDGLLGRRSETMPHVRGYQFYDVLHHFFQLFSFPAVPPLKNGNFQVRTCFSVCQVRVVHRKRKQLPQRVPWNRRRTADYVLIIPTDNRHDDDTDENFLSTKYMNIQTDKKRSQSMYFFPTFILTNGLIKARDNNYKVVFVSMTFYYINNKKKNMKKC